MTQNQQLGILDHITPRECRDSSQQPASKPVGERDQHPVMLPTPLSVSPTNPNTTHDRVFEPHGATAAQDAALVIAALHTAFRAGQLTKDAIIPTDRGAQGGFNWSSQHLD